MQQTGHTDGGDPGVRQTLFAERGRAPTLRRPSWCGRRTPSDPAVGSCWLPWEQYMGVPLTEGREEFLCFIFTSVRYMPIFYLLPGD